MGRGRVKASGCNICEGQRYPKGFSRRVVEILYSQSRLRLIVAVDQTDIDTVGLILAVAMVNASKFAGFDSWSKAAWLLLALTSKMAVDMSFCT